MDKCSCLHYVKTTPLLAVKEHPLTCSLYILNVLANHQLQIIKVPHLYPLPNQLVFELILDHKFTPSQCRKNKLKKIWRETSLGHIGMICLLMIDSIFTVPFACSVVQNHSCFARVHRQFILNWGRHAVCILRDSTLLAPNLPCAKGHSEIDHCFTKVRNPDTVDFPELDHFYLEILFK